jgi:O-acetyl-ADP-ribose deacetylase (regulator of RNase III)
MTPIAFIKGDATLPQAEGPKIIAHVCNDLGVWGKGFVMAISARWQEPEQAYRQWCRDGTDFTLGSVQLIQVESSIWVANMVAQHGIRRAGGVPPIRYQAVEACLAKVGEHAGNLVASVHMPRIGCGLAGGTWEQIEPLILKTLCKAGVSVTVYDF